MRTIFSFLLAGALLPSCIDDGDEARRATRTVDTPSANEEPAAAPARRNDAPTGRAAGSNVRAAARFAVPIEGLPSMGSADALVTIVEFVDYDCPFCGKAEHTIRALREKYGRDVRVVVAELPLPFHAGARPAALAALAADDVGAFESLHPKLFENPDARSDAELLRLATDVGIDARAFERALASGNPRQSLADAEALAATLNLRGTPVFFVNGRKISGAQPLSAFESIVAEELSYARELVAKGLQRDRVYDELLERASAAPPPSADEATEAQPLWVPDAVDAGGAHFLGSSNAPTTIVLFSDFQCPYSKRLDERLRELTARRHDVRVVFSNLPLRMHPDARLAAKGAIAADAQGKLEAYAKTVFDHQDELDRASLESYAASIGLDVERFSRDLDSAAIEARLAEDEALAKKLGVTGTPVAFVGGVPVRGAQPLAAFEDALRQVGLPRP